MQSTSVPENLSSLSRLALEHPPKVLVSVRTGPRSWKLIEKLMPRDAWRAMVIGGTAALSQNLKLGESASR